MRLKKDEAVAVDTSKKKMVQDVDFGLRQTSIRYAALHPPKRGRNRHWSCRQLQFQGKSNPRKGNKHYGIKTDA